MDIETIISVVESAKYPLLFLIYLIEGPVAAFLSSIAASLGHLDIRIVWLLVVFAEVFADYFFFYLGKKSTNTKVMRKVNELNNDWMKEIKRLASENLLFILFILKFVGPLYLPGFLYLGGSRQVQDSRFLLYASIICILKDTGIMFLGYVLGLELSQFEDIYQTYQLIGILGSIVLIILFLVKVYNKQILEGVEKFVKKR